MGSRVVHVCCPGPSFEWPNPDDRDLVVGVNVAIAKMERCDIWAALGHPGDRVLAPVIGRVLSEDCVVLSMGESARAWRSELHRAVVDWDKMTPWWFERVYRGVHFSMFTALSWVFSNIEATVHLWGCDMKGAEYCTGQKPHGERWMEMKRWPDEFRNLKRIHAAALEHRVDFRVHGGVAHRLPRPVTRFRQDP